MLNKGPSDDEFIQKAFKSESKFDKFIYGGDSALETVLLLLALPVLIPSLLINFLMAKRWGRVDFILLAVDGFIILLFCLGSPVYFTMALIAMISSGILYIVRSKKLQYGIFLGYSNAVAMLLMLGGVLFGIGYFGFIPWTDLANLSTVLGSAKEVTVRNIMDNRIGPYNKIKITDAELDWENHLYRVQTPEGARFVSFASDAGKENVIGNPNDLWGKRDEYLGMKVTLNQSIMSTDTLKKSRTEIQRSKDGPKEADNNERLFALVPNTEGRVWIASKPLTGTVEEDFLKQTGYSGTVVIAYTDPDMGRWYHSRFDKNLPYMTTVIWPEETSPQPVAAATKPADFKPLETWIPVVDSHATIWVAYPGNLSEEPSGEVKGIFEGYTTAGSEVLKYFSDHPNQDYRGGQIQVLANMSTGEYIKQYDLVNAFFGGFRFMYLGFMIPGIGVIIYALMLAKRE